ncbi:helix-turn-helix transcriptional regulator [Microvirga sp. P5_D2]
MTSILSKLEQIRKLKQFDSHGADPLNRLEQLGGLSIPISHHKVMNTAEAAAFLGFSVPHFRRLYRSGSVPLPIQLSTRKLGWRTGDLIDWVTARQNRPVTAQ